MRAPTIKVLGVALALLSSGALQAANMAFMADQAMSRFTEQDAQFFNEAATNVLKGQEGVEIKWSNPAPALLAPSLPTRTRKKTRNAASFTWSTWLKM